MRRRLLVGAVIVLVLVVAGGLLVGVRLWRDRHDSALEDALAYAPKDGQRYSWTDWAGVRRELDASVGADSSAAEVADFLDRAEDADLTTSSALASSADALKEVGIPLVTLDWELLVGKPLTEGAGQVDLAHLPGSVSFDAVRDALTQAGYRVPGDSDGVWDGSAADVSQTTTLLSYVALDEKDHVALLSDDREALDTAVDALGSSDDLPDGIAQAAQAVGSPLSAEIDSGSYLCNALALSHADASDQQAGQAAIAAAGKISPVRGFAMGVEPGGGDLLVAMTFASHDQAKANADSRSRLAVGPAAGQSSGDFTEMFTLGEVRADDDVVTMRLQPQEDQLYSDLLSGGPILFATC